MQVEGCDGETICGARPKHCDPPLKTRWTWLFLDVKIEFCFQYDVDAKTKLVASFVCAIAWDILITCLFYIRVVE